jgi:hypothetical protein
VTAIQFLTIMHRNSDKMTTPLLFSERKARPTNLLPDLLKTRKEQQDPSTERIKLGTPTMKENQKDLSLFTPQLPTYKRKVVLTTTTKKIQF